MEVVYSFLIAKGIYISRACKLNCASMKLALFDAHENDVAQSDICLILICTSFGMHLGEAASTVCPCWTYANFTVALDLAQGYEVIDVER